MYMYMYGSLACLKMLFACDLLASRFIHPLKFRSSIIPSRLHIINIAHLFISSPVMITSNRKRAYLVVAFAAVARCWFAPSSLVVFAFVTKPSQQFRTSVSLQGVRRGSTASAGGFAKGMGAKSGGKAKKGKKRPAPSYELKPGTTIKDVLNPRLLEDPSTLKGIKERIRAGEICVIRDAFIEEFAEAMYEELDGTDAWSRNEDYFDDGYGFRHNNVYSKSDFSPLFLQANAMFETDETKEFMTELTGRDCTGESVGAPSYYEVGDHSLPHTDHVGQRSVAYIWHLSKNWKAEYGGGLYWAPEPLANAYLHASFNTLVLFSVTPFSSHFVTTVSPRSKGKRLAYNGWWHSSWVPTASDPLEETLATPEQRLTLTHAQIQCINDMLDDPWAPRIQPPERHEQIVKLREDIMEELYPHARSDPVNVAV